MILSDINILVKIAPIIEVDEADGVGGDEDTVGWMAKNWLSWQRQLRLRLTHKQLAPTSFD